MPKYIYWHLRGSGQQEINVEKWKHNGLINKTAFSLILSELVTGHVCIK